MYQALSASDALKSDQGGAWRTDDALLIPVIPDDPLLRKSHDTHARHLVELMIEFGFDDAWSDDGFEAGPSNPQQSKSANPSTEVEQLRKELATAQMLLQQTLDDTEPITKGKKRDDDTHYFDSYAENGTSLLAAELTYRYPRDHAQRYHSDSHLCSIHPIQP